MTENFGKWIPAKVRGCHKTKDREALCASKVHGDRVNNQYRGIYELNTSGKGSKQERVWTSRRVKRTQRVAIQ